LVPGLGLGQLADLRLVQLHELVQVDAVAVVEVSVNESLLQLSPPVRRHHAALLRVDLSHTQKIEREKERKQSEIA
jgi:hypothetical protein